MSAYLKLKVPNVLLSSEESIEDLLVNGEQPSYSVNIPTTGVTVDFKVLRRVAQATEQVRFHYSSIRIVHILGFIHHSLNNTPPWFVLNLGCFSHG